MGEKTPPIIEGTGLAITAVPASKRFVSRMEDSR